MSSFDLSKSYATDDEIVSRVNQDGTVVLMKMDDSEVFFKIEGVAAHIWTKVFQDGKNVGSAIDEVLEEYNVERDVVLKDTESFFSELTKLDLLK